MKKLDETSSAGQRQRDIALEYGICGDESPDYMEAEGNGSQLSASEYDTKGFVLRK